MSADRTSRCSRGVACRCPTEEEVALSQYLIGHDIGGTKCAVILGRPVDEGVEIVDRIQFPTRSELGPEHALSELERNTEGVLAKRSLAREQVKAIGISCGGPINSREGTVLSPPNLPGWDNIPIVRRFEYSLKLPVVLENDANACALAEWKWGAGRGTRNMIFLTFGTGMGAGLILDGRLHSGTNDLAGEVGHVRLAEDGPFGHNKQGSFEGFCSGGGIARNAQALARKAMAEGKSVAFCAKPEALDSVTTHAVADAARRGDEVAIEAFRVSGFYLGRGLAILIDILNPEVIVIGSIFARAHDLLWPAAQAVIAEEALSAAAAVCRVVPAELGEAIGDYASLSLADGR